MILIWLLLLCILISLPLLFFVIMYLPEVITGVQIRNLKEIKNVGEKGVTTLDVIFSRIPWTKTPNLITPCRQTCLDMNKRQLYI